MRINRIIVSLVLVFVLLLSGCGNSKLHKDIADKVLVPDGAQVLSDSELRELKKWFNEDLIRIRFLHSTYDAPNSIDMYSLFYYGNGDKIEMSYEEIGAFLKQFGWWSGFDTYRISGAEIDDVLSTYASISLEETDKVHLNALYHIEPDDNYYSMHSNVADEEFEPVCGYKHDGYIYVYYIGSVTVDTVMEGYFRVTLSENGDGYYFVANEYCDLTSETAAYKTEIYQEEVSEDPYIIEETIEIQPLEKQTNLCGISLDTAVVSIRAQEGFEEIELTGQSWTDISEYGTVIAGTINGKVSLYFAEDDGDVYVLPMPYVLASPSEMMVGGGGPIFEYMMQSMSLATDESGMPVEFTSWYCTLLLPTNELYVRTVHSSLAEG